MASASGSPAPFSTPTAPGNRGRGRPRLANNPTPATIPRRAIGGTVNKMGEIIPGTPIPGTRRRLPSFGMGYRPGGAGGGGRYIHPTTGEEVPAALYRDLVKKGCTLEELMESARKQAALHPPSGPPPASLDADGVYKPREERSYTEFHPDFEPKKRLFVYSAEEVDGDRYQPPNLDHQKTAKIPDIKEEEDEDNNMGDQHLAVEGSGEKGGRESRSASAAGYPASPSIRSTANTPRMDIDDPPHLQPKTTFGYPVAMEGVESTDPSLAGFTPPPPSSIDFSLATTRDGQTTLESQKAQVQTQTPAATPTDLTQAEETTRLPPPQPSTPSAQTGSPRRGKDNTPTLASLRPHRSNAGKIPTPRPPPPSTSRRSSRRETHNAGDEKLHLRDPSFRLIQPYKYSDIAWTSEIGTTGGYGLNNPTSQKLSDRMINVGYQRTPKFERPQTLIRYYPDPAVDEDLGTTTEELVEYDMDEQDEKWLTSYNNIHSQTSNLTISRELFELAMTKVEKEWVALERRIPKQPAKANASSSGRRRSAAQNGEEPEDEGSEDSKCAICDDGECENANAIVFCDGCDLAVHQECYGVPYIPEGQWHCRKCQQIPRQTAHCVFCPNTDGAFKQTTTNLWAHLLCAIWIPEVRLANPAFMEPVEGLESVPRSRWKLHCYICKQKMGACIQCSNKSCYLAFHVTCGRRARLHMKMKNSSGPGAQLESSGLKAYCDKHVPPDWRRENDVDNAIIDAMEYYAMEFGSREWGDSQAAAVGGPSVFNEDDYATGPLPRINLKVNNKRKRPETTEPPELVWKLQSGAPVIPRVLFAKIVDHMTAHGVEDAQQFTSDICKYWTLKREVRRGACLIRRLQVQADSSSFTSLEVTRKNYAALGRARGEKQLEIRKEFAQNLQHNMAQLLEMVSSEQWQQRKEWINDADKLREYIDAIYFPELQLMRTLLSGTEKLDTNRCFQRGWYYVRDRIEHRLYPTIAALARDIRAVVCSSPDAPELQKIPVEEYRTPTFVPNPQSGNTEKSEKDITALGEQILLAMEEPLKTSEAMQHMIWKMRQERPGKRLKFSDTLDQNEISQQSSSNSPGKVVDSPSAQLAQESFPQKPKLAPSVSSEINLPTLSVRNTGVLAEVVTAVSSALNPLKWTKSYPPWFVNDYGSNVFLAETISSVDFDQALSQVDADPAKLVPRVVDESQGQPVALSPPSPASLQPVSAASESQPIKAPTTPVPEVHIDTDIEMTDAYGDEDAPGEDDEDAPGEDDEDYIAPAEFSYRPSPYPDVGSAPPPSIIPPTSPDVVPPSASAPPAPIPGDTLSVPSPYSLLHPDLHDEDAEGEPDDEMIPPPQQILQRLEKPSNSVLDRVAKSQTAHHASIRNDENLMGGYRAEDLPSPLADFGDHDSGHPVNSEANGDGPGYSSENQQQAEQTDNQLLPELPRPSSAHSSADNDQMLEEMTNTSVLSDYPDTIPDSDLPPVLESSGKAKSRASSGSPKKNTTPQANKKAGFQRDSNGKFRKGKAAAGGSGTPDAKMTSTPRSRRKRA
ncbi:hypothetical protein EX30DRAFT_332820 [Ascodesmis nigricans]|uniref:PHD finger domain-containing protein n=1 Tax=Ascodesmis nigricans TaxID=341454 RepID=A0A4S2MTU2_9PEZI|nr:hypothetical protein EX30DRAFT_332820 [Ascodesmis nigricans]